MSLPILQSITINKPQFRGDVIIDKSAIIADGVILNASQGTKIIIRAGVCLGMGTIITAYEGDIEIKENVILGSGTLIVGNCIIGAQASLGASVTVYNSNIESRSVIPAGTVIGDRSRSIDSSQNNQNKVNQSPPFDNPYSQYKISSPPLKTESSTNLNDEEDKTEKTTEIKPEKTPQKATELEEKFSNKMEQNLQQDRDNTTKTEEIKDKNDNLNSRSTNNKVTEEVAEVVDSDPWQEEVVPSQAVVGKVYINKLLFTLFPEKKN